MKKIDDPLTIVIPCHNCGDTAATIKAEPCYCQDGTTKEQLFGMHFDYDFPGVGQNGSFESGSHGEKIYRGFKSMGAAYFDSRNNVFLHYGIAGFYCSICMKSYCHTCWKNHQEETEDFAEGVTETTIYAECPEGHRQSIRRVMY